jgi:cysteine-rich repeat protein
MLPLNQWSHVAITNDGNNFIFYVDGVEKGRDTTPSFVNLDSPYWTEKDLYFGKRRAGLGVYDGYLDGLIDEFAIYNKALNQTEIQELIARSNNQEPYCEVSVTPAVCGNGIIDPGEVCDDGNTVDCDGCKGDCSRLDDVCGDGIEECFEDCDPPEAPCNPPYGELCSYCANNCQEMTVEGPHCGDHVVNGPEVCDGNPQSCYTGPGGTQGIGICQGGEYPCLQDCTGWNTASCIGEILPGLENTYALCVDSIDNDCDGTCDFNGCNSIPRDTSCEPGAGAPPLPQCAPPVDLNDDNSTDVIDIVLGMHVVVDDYTSTPKGCEAWLIGVNP